MFLLFIAFRIHAKFSNRQTDNIIVELHIKIRKKRHHSGWKSQTKNIFCAYPDVTHQLFLALILISNMSRGKRLPHIATKAIKTTSREPTFVLVAAPFPRFAMPSLMLLVVEVIAWLSRPVCSESTNSIKEGIANLGKGAATSTKVCALLVVLMAFVA